MSFGGGGSNQAGGPPPIPILQQETQSFGNVPWPNIGSASSNAYSGIAGLNVNPAAQYGGYGSYSDRLADQGNFLDTQLANSWGGAAFNSGNAAGNAALPWGSAAFNSGNNAAATGANLYNQLNPYANQALASGFNDQNALYNQLYQRNQDQTNAQDAMSGVATTPYGAMLANQSSQDFNNKWQQFLNQQQAQGANTAATLDSTGINALLGGVGAQQAGQGLGSNILSGLTGVNQAGMGLGANINSNLDTTGANLIGSGLQNRQSIDTQQYNAQQQQIQDYLNYLQGSGNNAAQYLGLANQTFGLGVNQAGITSQADLNANNSLLGSLTGLGSLAGSIGRFFI